MYYYTDILFAISENGPYTSIQQLLFPFGSSVWYCVIAMFAIGIMIILKLKLFGSKQHQNFVFGENNSIPLLNMVSTYLGGSVNPLPKRNFARYILYVWMLSSIVLQNSYQGSLFKFLRTPKTIPLPTTVSQMVAENYKFYIPDIYIGYFQHLLEMYKQSTFGCVTSVYCYMIFFFLAIQR